MTYRIKAGSQPVWFDSHPPDLPDKAVWWVMTSPTLEKSESSRVGTHTRHGRFSHMDRDAYITINELSNGKRVLYDKRDVDGTFVEYTPPKDKMKRLYLGP